MSMRPVYEVRSNSGYEGCDDLDQYYDTLQEARAECRRLRSERHDYQLSRIVLASMPVRKLLVRAMNGGGYSAFSVAVEWFDPCCDPQPHDWMADQVRLGPGDHADGCTVEKRRAARPQPGERPSIFRTDKEDRDAG